MSDPINPYLRGKTIQQLGGLALSIQNIIAANKLTSAEGVTVLELTKTNLILGMLTKQGGANAVHNTPKA